MLSAGEPSENTLLWFQRNKAVILTERKQKGGPKPAFSVFQRWTD
jgi:hypothetical protein